MTSPALLPGRLELLRAPGTDRQLQLAGDGRLTDVETAAHFRVEAGVPVLLWPEATIEGGGGAPPPGAAYAEAYRDMAHYAGVATGPGAIEDAVDDHGFDALWALSEAERRRFPDPESLWLARREGLFDLVAESDAYRSLRPLAGARVLQAGGRGTHAVKFLLAGAREAWLLTPVVEEARFALALAERAGVAGRFAAVAGVSEEPPLAPGAFDTIYSPGSLHHTDVARALPALAALLAPGGRLATVDPWRAPGYGIGTRMLGKRERDVACRPLDADRIRPALAPLPALQRRQYGALSRYGLIALSKAGVALNRATVTRIGRADDAVSSRVPGLRGAGSSVALFLRKP